jgi:hypothetical protein
MDSRVCAIAGAIVLAACTQTTTTNTTTNNVTQQQIVVGAAASGTGQANAIPAGGIGACTLEPQLKSQVSAQAIAITFRNETSGDVTPYWLDFQGQRKPYPKVEKGSSRTQSTYVTHPWVITDAAGKCLEIVMPGRTTQTVVVRNQSPPPAPTARQ